MSTAEVGTVAAPGAVIVETFQHATLEPAPAPGAPTGKFKPSPPDDWKEDDEHVDDAKAWYDEEGCYLGPATEDHDTHPDNALMNQSEEVVLAMELDRAMTFYSVSLPIEASFRDLCLGDQEIAIHEDEKAVVFMNFLRHKPNFCSLYDLVHADDYDLIDWSSFQVDEKGIYTVERVYLEITWAVNKMRRNHYEYPYNDV